MGCDIHTYTEVKKNGEWVCVEGVYPFDWRQYGVYGFLADVRNYSHVPVIAEPKMRIPPDASKRVQFEYDDGCMDWHTATWLTLRQLMDFYYDQIFWDRRVVRDGDGAATAEEGEGEHLTIREFLGESFFRDLEELKDLGEPDDVRVVFWFDN